MFFISPRKLFPFSRCLNFCFDFLIMCPNGFIKKIRLISNFMASQTSWLINNCNTHTAKYWRSKGNQTIKFGQLIQCYIRKIFLEKSYTKCGGETIPRHFFRKLKLSISLDQQSKVLYSLLLLYGKLMVIEIFQN